MKTKITLFIFLLMAVVALQLAEKRSDFSINDKVTKHYSHWIANMDGNAIPDKSRNNHNTYAIRDVRSLTWRAIDGIYRQFKLRGESPQLFFHAHLLPLGKWSFSHEKVMGTELGRLPLPISLL